VKATTPSWDIAADTIVITAAAGTIVIIQPSGFPRALELRGFGLGRGGPTECSIAQRGRERGRERVRESEKERNRERKKERESE
jgi:hypothetical protein